MSLHFQLLLILSVTLMKGYGQNKPTPFLNLGDPAPRLNELIWIKGKPIEKFEKGKIYVLEFWATWCIPCIAAMPRFSKLAREFKKKAVFVGIDVLEKKSTSINKVIAFVDSMRYKIKFHVAVENSQFMDSEWLKASNYPGIPTAFIVDADGNLAWIGHPMHLHEVLVKILNKSWDIEVVLAKQQSDMQLQELDHSLNYDLLPYNSSGYENFYGEPDSSLLKIDTIIKNEPKLKYAPLIAYNTFSSLLKIDLHKAYEYGREVLATPTYDEPAAKWIVEAIKWYSDKLTLSPEIYELGADAYQQKLDQMPYPEIVNTFGIYNKMAEWYWLAGNKSKAIYAEKKAIKYLKRK